MVKHHEQSKMTTGINEGEMIEQQEELERQEDYHLNVAFAVRSHEHWKGRVEEVMRLQGRKFPWLPAQFLHRRNSFFFS